MKSFLFVAALALSGAAVAQVPSALPAASAPVAAVANTVMDHMAKPAEPAPVVAETPASAAPAPVAQTGPVPHCSKTVTDGCMNGSHAAKHAGHGHAARHGKHKMRHG
jgi:hypothetical protein